ncbi:MAG: hypothetical protein JO353_07105 [Phycisphaerae bacterium]|nr:hypothetical protein [Phycisphaerae bacterium]
MSTTSVQRSRADALDDAKALNALFPQHTYSKWTIAGSVRRNKESVSDVEHVIIPAFTDGASASLFGEKPKINLFLTHLDSLLSTSYLCKHIYPDGKFRWGDRYRGVDFRDYMHEFFLPDETNYGSILAIRTGPPEFSRQLVTGLLRNGRRNKDGYVRKCVPCSFATATGKACEKSCSLCHGTQLEAVGDPLAVPTEEEYFALCGVPWCAPEDRR